MKKAGQFILASFFLVFTTVFLVSCATAEQTFRVADTHFKNKDGCFLIYDLKREKLLYVHGEKRCREEMPACSTFKFPLAIFGFDSEILKDENTSFRWDGKKRSIESWNQDQTASSWMKNSVVWYSQKITSQMGAPLLQNYLDRFEYGNRDISAGLTTAWLTVDNSASLKISAYGQIEFLKKFWTDKLFAKNEAIEKTKRIMFLETSPRGYELHGKTGSGFLDNPKRDIGWFVGHVQGQNREVIFVSTFTQAASETYGGPVAKEIAKNILKENGLW